MPAADDTPTPTPDLPTLGVSGDPCAGCGTPLAGDQRYCLECGRRRGAARLDVLAQARARARVPRTLIHSGPVPVAEAGAAAAPRTGPRALPSPRVAASLCLAMLAGGIALGAAAGPNAPDTFAAGGRRIIAVLGPAPAPAPDVVAAAPGPDTTAPEDSAPADDASADTGTVASGGVADSSTATDAPVPAPVAVEPAAPSGTDTPELAAPSPLPPIRHVWLISLTGQRYAETWGPAAADPTFKALAARGTVLPRLFAVAHGALPNGIALLSGQGPNPATQAGCATPQPLLPGTTATEAEDPLQQASGTGCIYPATVQTLPDQLTGGGLTWKAYVESIASPDPAGAQSCRHPDVGTPDPATAPRPGDPYLTARNPFVFFASIVQDAVCASQVVGLDRLAPDLAAADQTPNFSYIVPDACHDGRAEPCAPGAPAGLAAAAPWLKGVVDQITATKAYRDDGLIIVTGDQAPADGPLADARGCRCAGMPWPNTPDAGTADPVGLPVTARAPHGGGRVGALLLSPFVTPGRSIPRSYDHVSLLKTVEDLFGLPHLGAANDPERPALGPGAFAKDAPERR